MLPTFTAIDFETAHEKRWSICQVGIVRIEEGLVKNQFSVLVKPPNNLYSDRCTQIHGIDEYGTRDADTFDIVWQQIAPFIVNQTVVAHNGFSFDFNCLKQGLEYYSIEVPLYQAHCTYKIYGDNLASLCKKHSIPLNHHDALSDASACAELYQIYLKKQHTIS